MVLQLKNFFYYIKAGFYSQTQQRQSSTIFTDGGFQE